MVLVTVHGDGKSKHFKAGTAAELLPAVFLVFGPGFVADAADIVLTAGYGDLGAGSYSWTAPAAACSSAGRDSDASSDGAAIDEGAEEAAWDNAYTQQMYAELQRPEVYQSMGLSGPPKSFTPPDLETYVQSMRLVGISGV